MKRKVKHKVIAPNIVRGGQAIPMGNNFYYMKGRKHNQGGIDIGKNPRTGLEVEDGEIMKMSPKEVKVYSSVPFLNGKSPAQKVLGGENPNKVFRQQENYKDRNGIKDDGTMARMGKYFNQNTLDKTKNSIVYSLTNNGKTSLRMLPSTGDRIKAELGVVKYLKNVRDYFKKGLEKSRKNKTVRQVQQEVTKANKRPSIGYASLAQKGKSKTKKGEYSRIRFTNKFAETIKDNSHPYNHLLIPINSDGSPAAIIPDNKIPSFYPKNKSNYNIDNRKYSYSKRLIANKDAISKRFDTENKNNKTTTNNSTKNNVSIKVNNKNINSNTLSKLVVIGKRNAKSSVNKQKPIIASIKNNNSANNAKTVNNKNNITKNINKKRLIDANDKNDTVEAIKGISSNDFKLAELPKTYDSNLEKYAFDPHVYDLDVPFVERKKKFGGRKRAEWGTNFWKNLAEEQEKEKRRWDSNNKVSGNYNFNNAVILNTNDLPKAENTVVKGSIDNLNIPSYIKNNKNSKFNNFLTKMKTSVGNYFKDKDNVSDTIGLGSNLLGNIISSGINSRMINNIQMPNKPTAPINKRATKLKTKININPQLANMRESLAAYERSVDENTSSSQVALSRKQRARVANLLNTNTLYANKENQETELINRDRLNQQTVANENVAAYNNYLDRLMDYENKKTEIENKKIELSAENKIATIENINNSIQNLLTNRQKRKSEKQNIAAMSFANPNLPAEMLYAQGLINKETYDAYRKAYPLKNT